MTFRLKIISALICSFIFILIFLPWNSITEFALLKVLTKQGLKKSELTVSDVGLSNITINNLSTLSGGVKLKELKVTWTLSGLLNKEVEDIQLDGLEVNTESILPDTDNKKSKPLKFSNLIKELPLKNGNLNITLPKKILNKYMIRDGAVNITIDKKNSEITLRSLNKFKISSDEFDLDFDNLSIKLNIIGETLRVSFPSVELDLKYKITQKPLSEVALNSIKINNKSFLNIISTNNGIKVETIQIDIDQNSGFLDNQINWEKIDLSLKGSLQNLEVNGHLNNISHTESNCVKDLDLEINALKSEEHYSVSISTPKNRKDLQITVKALIGDIVRFNVKSKKLSEIDFKTNFPCIGKDISSVGGSLSLLGYKSLSKNGKEKLDLSLENGQFQWEEMVVKGLDVKFNLINFNDFSSKKYSSLKIKKADLGIDISDLDIIFKIQNKKLIDVNSVQFSILDGNVRVEPFLFYRLTNKFKKLTVEVDDIPLEKALKMGLKDAVEASGMLTGSLPIIWKGEIPEVLNGKLETKDKGVLKYRPKSFNPLKKTGNLHVEMLSDYLWDFHYDKLSIDVDSDEKYNLEMKTSILGKNLKVNNGRPLKFGLNLDLDVKDTLISTLFLMEFPKKIEQSILEKLKK
ncbi:MAG: YdbH domain-containing protein [Bacteriovoracaceae bacterium]|nr:YdbH domain-containing protein [Bacteriovoracaceae bacterium]